MVEMLERDRQTLTSSVLRIVKASSVLATAALEGKWSFVLLQSNAPAWAGTKLWDGNEAVGGVRFGVQRTMLAACEQGRGVAELARSSHGYTVALATLTRGVVEALGRARWILSSEVADDLLIRHASLEFGDLRYPAQHTLNVHHVGVADQRVPAATYRQGIMDGLSRFGLAVSKVGLMDLAIGVLREIYNEAPQLYSGLSAAAHGQGWATGNFFDATSRTLLRDDQMLIEYCAYVIETTILVSDLLIATMVPDQASVDRWTSARDQVDAQLSVILRKRDVSSLPN
ncbi:MAG TPA: hypothetical protein VHZ98_15925 [Galbitalea sp.]|jgi:hypothetical protein|nr:hypothetical protein [Galbitalea sp.]